MSAMYSEAMKDTIPTESSMRFPSRQVSGVEGAVKPNPIDNPPYVPSSRRSNVLYDSQRSGQPSIAESKSTARQPRPTLEYKTSRPLPTSGLASSMNTYILGTSMNDDDKGNMLNMLLTETQPNAEIEGLDEIFQS